MTPVARPVFMKPFPGTGAAIGKGCTCPTIENLYRDPSNVVLDPLCPLHNPTALHQIDIAVVVRPFREPPRLRKVASAPQRPRARQPGTCRVCKLPLLWRPGKGRQPAVHRW